MTKKKKTNQLEDLTNIQNLVDLNLHKQTLLITDTFLELHWIFCALADFRILWTILGSLGDMFWATLSLRIKRLPPPVAGDWGIYIFVSWWVKTESSLA